MGEVRPPIEIVLTTDPTAIQEADRRLVDLTTGHAIGVIGTGGELAPATPPGAAAAPRPRPASTGPARGRGKAPRATTNSARTGRSAGGEGPGVDVDYFDTSDGLAAASKDGRAVRDRREGEDAVGAYLRGISREPLLSAEQEVELSKRIEAGLHAENLLLECEDESALPFGATRKELELIVAEGVAAKKRFVEANLRLAVSIARRFVRVSLPMLDLIQEGNQGLMHAVEKFDYTKGYKFSTYATWWVRQSIHRAIANTERMVRLPVHVVEEVNRMRNAERDLTNLLGEAPTIEEVASNLGTTVEEVTKLRRLAAHTVSLDQPVGPDDADPLGDFVAETGADDMPLDSALYALQRDQVEAALNTLSERSRYILRLRFGFVDGTEYTLTQVAALLKLSRERIRQLENLALASLRGGGRLNGL